MEKNRTALYIYVPTNATPEEVEAAHEIIDRQFSADSGIAPSAIVSNNAQPGNTVSAASGDNTAAGAPQLDAAGLPWDERIHSSNRKFSDKGMWWGKRGVDSGTKAKVEAELRATMSANGTGTAAVVTTTTPAPAPAPLASTPPVTGLPPMPGAALPDPAYTALVQLVAQNTNSPANPAGRITSDWLKQVLTHYGVAEGNMQNLAHAPDLVAPIAEYIRTALAG